MFITLAQDEARERLRAAGYALVRTLAEGTIELWRHPRVGEVHVAPELDGTGAYEEVMILLIEAQARDA